jgi:hypothetical protein
MRADLRDALRSLLRERGFAALAVLLLAMSGGATTVVYAIVHAVLLEPLQLAQPNRTVVNVDRNVRSRNPFSSAGIAPFHTG